MKKLLFLLILNHYVCAQIPDEFEQLFNLSNQIRGSNYECDGIEMYEPYAKFRAQIEKDYNLKELKEIENYQAKFEYFSYWKYLSFDNFLQFKKFNSLAKSACANNIEHFEKLSDKKNAQNLCKRYVERFGERAFGAIKAPFRKLDSRFKRFLELDGNDAISYLSISDFSELELEFLLKLALLEHKDLSVINFLMQSGASLDNGYESALFYALDYPAGLKLLLANGAEVNYANSFNKTAIIYAIERNDIETVKTLLRFGARVDLISITPQADLPFYLSNCAFKHAGKTALMAAASSADVDMLKLLIQAGADYKITDAQGLSALDYALIYERKQNAEFLKSLKEAK